MLEQIKQLREMTGLSVMLCRKALEEADYDFDKALAILKARGAEIGDKKKGKETRAGIIESYIHSNNQIGVLIELRSETDFVSRNPQFKELAHDLSMHIAALNPEFLSSESVPEDIKESVKEVFRSEVENLDKPEKIKNQIIEGKLNKYLEEKTLLEQPFIKNQDLKIKDLLAQAALKFGEKIEVERFVRFEVR